MKRLAVITVFLIAPGLAMAQDSTAPTHVDRVKLWLACKPIGLVVDSRAAKTGLTEERIVTLVRSRLRAARIYRPREDVFAPFLYVNVNVSGLAFHVSFKLFKPVLDIISGKSVTAVMWYDGTTGTHGRDAGYILQSVSERTDQFIDEYLRVNAEACKR